MIMSVRLSVCLSHSSIVLKRQKISTRFLLHTTAPCLCKIILDHIKIWLIWINPFHPKLALKSPTPVADSCTQQRVLVVGLLNDGRQIPPTPVAMATKFETK